jgi:hypothetical protein
MSAGLKLQGQFKFDLYDRDNNLLKSSNYINNFITNSGLMYPLHFAFADCFRFLSVGSGNLQNSISTETTGLEIVIPELSYIGSRNDFEKEDSTNYAQAPSCGYRFPNPNIVELYRGWTLPNNSGEENGFFKNEGILKEFMVTPGRPYVTGEGGIKYCSCKESLTPIGKDCSSVADYYNFINTIDSERLKICDATAAFARVVLEDPINYISGSILNVTYKLTISIDSGINYKELYYDNISSIDGNFDGKWSLIQGVTQPGIKLINDGFIISKIPNAPNYSRRLQHFNYSDVLTSYDFKKEYGESFIPPHGIPLEPSVHNFRNQFENGNNSILNIIYYFTEDNTQFLVSETGGKFSKIEEFAPWNLYLTGKIYFSGDYAYSGNTTYKYINSQSNSGISLNNTLYWENLGYLKVISELNSGVKKFKNDVEKSLSQPYIYWYENPNEFNIRTKDKTIPFSGNILNEENLTKINRRNFSRSNPIIAFNFSNQRKVYLSTNISFSNYPFAQKFYIKNFVASYRDSPYGVFYGNYGGDSGNLVPFLDCIFSGSGKDFFFPKIITGIKNYGFPYYNTGAFISGKDNNEYFYLSNDQAQYPILKSVLEWSSNCPSSVEGCP